jgi:hypothetical protein
MRHTVTVYPVDRNQFVLNVGEVPQPEDPSGEEAAET